MVAALNDFASAGRKPDLTILLDLPPEIGFARISSRESEGFDRFENEKLDFHRAVRQAFLRAAEEEPGRFRVIDGTLSEAEIAEKIRQVVLYGRTAKILKPHGAPGRSLETSTCASGPPTWFKLRETLAELP